MTQNPAGDFIAAWLHEKFGGGGLGITWDRAGRESQAYWRRLADDLVIKMYAAGYRIPRPEPEDRGFFTYDDNGRRVTE